MSNKSYTHYVNGSFTYYGSNGSVSVRNWTKRPIKDFTMSSQNGNKISGTPHSYSNRRGNIITGSVNVRAGSSSGVYRGQFGTARAIAPGDAIGTRSNVRNQARQRMLEAIRGNLDLAVDAAEIGQTYNLLCQPLRGIETLFQSAFGSSKKTAKRGNRINSRRDWTNRPDKHNRSQQAVDGITEAYLQVNHGVKPLLASMFNIVSTYAESLQKDDGDWRIVKGSAKDSCSQDVTTGVVVGVGEAWTKASYSSTYDSMCTCYAMLKLPGAVKAQLVSTYANLNPYNLAYQTTGLSWAVDYIYDIGGWLQSVETAKQYKKYVSGTWDSELRITNTYLKPCPGFSSSGAFYTPQLYGFARNAEFTRSVGSLTMPSRPVSKSFNTISKARFGNLVSKIAQMLL